MDKLEELRQRIREANARKTNSNSASNRIESRASASSEQQVTKPNGNSSTAESIAERLRKRAEATTINDDTAIKNEIVGKADVTVDMLNEKQRQAVTMMEMLKSFVLIGAAGSGKTTTVRLGIEALAQAGKIGTLTEDEFTNVLKAKAPRIAIVSYTNVAVRNIKSILPPQFAQHCCTIHTLLNYIPEELEVDVKEDNIPTGETKMVKRFIPNYGCEPEDGGSGLGNKLQLPHLDLIIVEEAGTVPVHLFKTLMSALPNSSETAFMFLGDIQQLPPAFGDGILGFKQLELPVVPLEKTYRNVGLVTRLAHRVIEGRPILSHELKRWHDVSDDSGSIKMLPYKQRFTDVQAAKIVGGHFKQLVLAGKFNADDSVVLIPYNKGFGTIELNRWIAQGYSELNKQPVHEVIAGYERHYFSIGDKVMHNKQFYIIKTIEPNKAYLGTAKPLPPSRLINRWGQILPINSDERRAIAEAEGNGNLHSAQSQEQKDEAIDALLEAAGDAAREGITTAATHTLVLQLEDNPEVEVEVNKSAEINGMILRYALTVYKSQGSEWQTVYLALHNTHGKQLNRETLYTGITRARRNLIVMYNDERSVSSTKQTTFHRGIMSQAVPGNTIEEKLNHFKRKLGVEEKSAELKALLEKYKL